ncbi:MAG: succinyldiaminopimelate transaminase [Betaproteobacteria bacterium]
MNRFLSQLQPYPFERLRSLLSGVTPAANHSAISLSIGEPRHPTPALLVDALREATAGLAVYPPTAGSPALREAISQWIGQRYRIPSPDPATQVLPVNGSREALFSFAQTVLDPATGAWFVCPNPFYQIYEGAALLAGGRTWFVNQTVETGFRCDFDSVPDDVWRGCRLLFTCSPGNPTGAVMTLDDWRRLFELSDRHQFVIASDECYSEIYFDEDKPPLGALEAARKLGRDDYRRLMVFSSLSKRSNAPGLRSGFVAGDASLIKPFLLYRTYHGGAMSPTVQQASIAAWNDESHVAANRQMYREKFDSVTPVIARVLAVEKPEAGFYLWARVPDGDDQAFCRRLLAEYNVLVLPGSFLAREQHGINPGRGYVRLALVDGHQQCLEAAQRIEQMLSR